jgi:hypothetical protein
MKIDKYFISQFESDQKHYGTEIAIYNLLWQHIADQFKDIGVRHLQTAHNGYDTVKSTSYYENS